MHEPDKQPDTSIFSDERFMMQWLANASLVCGGVTLIGMALAVASGKAVFFGLAAIGVALAVIAMKLAKKTNDERARATAVIAIIINVVLFFILLIIFLFFKEAAKAM